MDKQMGLFAELEKPRDNITIEELLAVPGNPPPPPEIADPEIRALVALPWRDDYARGLYPGSHVEWIGPDGTFYQGMIEGAGCFAKLTVKDGKVRIRVHSINFEWPNGNTFTYVDPKRLTGGWTQDTHRQVGDRVRWEGYAPPKKQAPVIEATIVQIYRDGWLRVQRDDGGEETQYSANVRSVAQSQLPIKKGTAL